MPYERPMQKSKMNAKIDVASETAASWDTDTFPIIKLSKTPTVMWPNWLIIIGNERDKFFNKWSLSFIGSKYKEKPDLSGFMHELLLNFT